jgi:Domain of unknown function (DUF5606)
MDIKLIMSIAGHQGLYKYVAEGRNGVIVENLENKKRINAYSSFKISSLSDIAIFTDSGEVALKEVLLKIKEKENAGPALNPKAGNEELKKYLESILPDYDRERVYVSDIKKLVQWYNILQKADMLEFDEPKTEEPAAEVKTEEDTPKE